MTVVEDGWLCMHWGPLWNLSDVCSLKQSYIGLYWSHNAWFAPWWPTLRSRPAVPSSRISIMQEKKRVNWIKPKLKSLYNYIAPRSRGERILFFWPNTNTNIIRNQNFDQIRIRIIFVFSEWANTNNIRAQIFGRIRIRIIFGFRIVPEYEYE